MQNLVPFEVKSVIRHDKTQLHVLTDIWTTGEATHTRERRKVLIVELTLILFRVTFAKQHLRIVMKSWQIGYRETRRSRSNTLILRQGSCWNKAHVCLMKMMNSQRSFNFSWIALTRQQSHQLQSFRSGDNPCIPMVAKH